MRRAKLLPRLLLTVLAAAFGSVSASNESLVGSQPSNWEIADWLNTRPVSLEALRGRVVLVRWWTTGCMLCATSTGALNILHDRYAEEGLFVTGFYHHKSEGPLEVTAVHDYARRFGYRFPIAVDHDWRTLSAWWLNGGERDYTSVSFLLDREGVVRYVHAGGRLSPTSDEFQQLESLIQQLL